ncbi:MAG: NAD(P)/FAD-dependent oxidoreductase, partial [Clostridia bacterium]|nr:NAD(P)/FAD-dependent oxidoreductase [Clostridia bacterium]
ILTDTKQKTSENDIYAAGDCCQGYDASVGQNRVLAIFPNAFMQGFVAGVNMAGGNATYGNGIPLNAIGFFGLHALTAGSYDGELLEEKDEKHIKRLFIRNDRLVGFMLIGEFSRAGILTSLIREKTPLSSVDWEKLKKIPVLSAFSIEKRKTILGGVI